MDVVMAIKPIYVKKIFDGSKQFELRKVAPQKRPVGKILIYESSPTSGVVGSFVPHYEFTHDIDGLWRFVKSRAGITKEEFYKYFNGKTRGTAIRIRDVIKYDQIIPLYLLGVNRAPQNFIYL